MKRVLLTGIGGSIGVHVFAHIMKNTDWHVVGIDSLRHHGMSERVVEICSTHPDWPARLTWLTHDLTAPISSMMVKKIGEIDYILNLASLSDVHDSLVNPVPFVQNNVNLILNMMEYARESKPKAFLHISTDEVYGPTDGETFHKEWSPIVPSSPYSASKAAQEAISISYWRAYNVPLILVNLMNNFGEMQSPRKFPVIVQKKVNNGETITIHGRPDSIGSRYYIHSRNSADAFLYILRNTTPHLHVNGTQDKPDRYNIPGDMQIDNLELLKLIAAFMERPFTYKFEDFNTARPGHDHHYGLDGQKLYDLGWESPRHFQYSLQDVVKWQQEHPEWLE